MSKCPTCGKSKSKRAQQCQKCAKTARESRTHEESREQRTTQPVAPVAQEPPITTPEPPELSQRAAPPAPPAKLEAPDAKHPASEATRLRAQHAELLKTIKAAGGRSKRLDADRVVIEGRIRELERSQPPAEPDWHFMPEGEALPTEHVKVRKKVYGCPECRRRHLPSGAQAVQCISSGGVTAFFRCMSCNHRWPLPVEVLRGE